MDKDERFTLRISKNELEVWNFYSISVGYESLSEFIRDSISGLIDAEKKPSKIFIIKGKNEV